MVRIEQLASTLTAALALPGAVRAYRPYYRPHENGPEGSPWQGRHHAVPGVSEHVSGSQPSPTPSSSDAGSSTTFSGPTGEATVAIPSTVLHSCAASLDGQPPAVTPPGWQFSGKARKYYVAAEEVEWNYVPSGWDNWLGVPFGQSIRAKRTGYLDYSTKWLKAFYRGYTDETFTEYSEQPPWQGSQGPTLRAEVGDLIEIMFVNNMTTNYATMHSMGLEYSKHSEGAAYPNGTHPDQPTHLDESNAVPPVDVGVEPNGCVVYKWMVTDIAGPNNGEPARAHSYHSFVSLYEDANSGLIGPTIIYAPGQMESTMANYREFPLLYMIYTEAQSFLSGVNHERMDPSYNNASISIDTQGLPPGNQSVWQPQLTNVLGAGQFSGAPSYHSLNGYLYANNPTFEMCLDDNVIWYVNAYGSASHVFHMHGNSFRYQGEGNYATSLNDGGGYTLYMDAVGRGLWQVVCHVDHHLSNGMVANYRVYDKGECPLAPLGA